MSKLSKALIAAAGNSGGAGLTVEDVFSTYLYTGTGSNRTVTNDIDLSGEGGLVWIKNRDRSTGTNHVVFDTERGTNKELHTNTTEAEDTAGSSLSAFNANGFDIDGFADNLNSSDSGANQYASWTFRKAEKFFDVVTYTGTGAAQTISHNLGSDVGFMVIKRTDTTGFWIAWHKDFASTADGRLLLNTTDTYNTSSTYWNSTAPTSTGFTVGTNVNTNASGATYVAYLFASDAGGFGDDGSENIIKCGSFTTDGSYNSSTTLGWEPQWVMVKRTDSTSGWFMWDMLRGMPTDGDSNWLYANTTGAEVTSSVAARPNANGFTTFNLSANGTYIYIAIRRPHKPAESGTEVFAIDTEGSTGDGKAPSYRSGFPVDMSLYKSTTGFDWQAYARLTGAGQLRPNLNDAEATAAYYFGFNNGWHTGLNTTSTKYSWMFKRATGFFDVVCYEGTGYSAANNGLAAKSHNLGVEPELIIVKARNSASYNWMVYHKYAGDPDHTATYGTRSVDKRIFLNLDSAASNDEELWGDETYPPNANEFRVRSNNSAVNASGTTYIAYLFASLPGVSKVSSYTGTGTTQTINCGFSSGARFVLIKRTDSTGDWYVWDSARGIVAGNDPALQLNSTAAEVTSADAIDPDSSGFIVNQEATCSINASGVSYIFMSIA